MANCPLADDCPSFSERIQGMGCQHYGDRGGAEWCNHYDMPISDLKQQPVKPGEEIVVEVTDIHESGSGVGRTEDGFIVLVDGTLPPARARVRIHRVKANHATADEVERLPMDEDEEDDEPSDDSATSDSSSGSGSSSSSSSSSSSGSGRPEQLGSRDNFWGG